jgi:hypothetical protein
MLWNNGNNALIYQEQCYDATGTMLWNVESNALIYQENAYRSVN